MEINVNLDAFDLDTIISVQNRYDDDGDLISSSGQTLGEVVADRAVTKLVNQVVQGREDYTPLVQRVSNIRNEMIQDALRPVIEEAITAPVTKTNTWGEATGETTTLRDVIIAETRKALTDGGSHYDRKPTLLQKLIAEEVGRAFQGEVAEAVKAEKEKAIAAVRASAATIIADAIKAGIGR